MAFINLKSHKAKAALNVVFSVGAAIVIFGAFAKIEHLGGVFGKCLDFGMITETCVFLLMAFQPPEEEYYWEKVIPNLNVHPSEEKKLGTYQEPKGVFFPGGGSHNSPMAGMDKMLEEAEITPTNLKRLSENFERLGEQLGKMADVSEVITVTGEYSQQTRETSLALQKMREAYGEATTTIAAFNNSAESTHSFHEQLQQMTRNLSSLNAIYELELQDTNNHMKAMNHFYGNLSQASQSMADSIEDTQRTQQQIALLADNLSSLNSVYGNMLSAMHR
jgi:gliding motility-associated protein GldL